MSAGPDARLKTVYESLFIVVAVDQQVSMPQIAALIRIAQARLDLGVSKAEYVEILQHVISALQAGESPAVADLALDALEMLVNAACPDVQQRQQLAIQVIAILQRWYKRVDRAQFALLGTLAEELEMREAMGDLAKEVREFRGSSEWAQLDGKRIGMYSLQEPALRRAAIVISELSLGTRVDTFSDHVGGSAALRKASSTADIFIIATGAAKHAQRPTLKTTGRVTWRRSIPVGKGPRASYLHSERISRTVKIESHAVFSSFDAADTSLTAWWCLSRYRRGHRRVAEGT